MARARARAEVHSDDYDPAFHARTWDNIWIDESELHRERIGVQLSKIAAERGVPSVHESARCAISVDASSCAAKWSSSRRTSPPALWVSVLFMVILQSGWWSARGRSVTLPPKARPR